MMYVSHPCADMVRVSITILWDTLKLINTARMRLNTNTNHCTSGRFNIRDDSIDGWHEDRYESEVVERNILNKVKIQRIDEAV